MRFANVTGAILAPVALLLLLVPLTVIAKPNSRLQPRFDKDAGIHRLAQVARIASRQDVVAMGDQRQLLYDAGISDANLGDGRVVSARVYCCGGPNEESEAIWVYVPPSTEVVVGDVIEVRMGDPKASGSLAAINVVQRIRAKPEEVPAKCHWDPPDDYKWARNLYCEGIEQEGWVHRGGIYNMWMKPRGDAAAEAQIQAAAAAPTAPAAAPATAAAAAAGLTAGAELFAMGDAPGALAAWEPLAQDGQQTAQLLALSLYETGAGVPRNDVRSADLYERLGERNANVDYPFVLSVWQPKADAGDAAAQYVVGWLHLMRAEGAAEQVEGVGWLAKSAGQDYGLAEWALGEWYARGEGVKKDEKEAFKWFQRGADHGNARAAYYVGVAYENGRGVRRSDEEAVRWYRTAGERGEAEGAHNYANMLAAGDGVARNEALAIEWYRKGAALGSSNAANNIGLAYATGRGVPNDMAQAYQWFNAAMARPFRLLDVQHGEANLRRAAGTVSSTARLQAKLKLAQMCADGQGLPQDDVQAWFWYELVTTSPEFRSSTAGTPEAQAIQKAQAEIAARLSSSSLARAQAKVRAWPYP
jgi:TPR repeat protein